MINKKKACAVLLFFVTQGMRKRGFNMNIKLPNDFKEIITSPKHVEVRLNSYWRKNKKDV